MGIEGDRANNENMEIDCLIHRIGIQKNTIYLNLNDKEIPVKIKKNKYKKEKDMRALTGYALVSKGDILRFKRYKDNKLKIPLIKSKGYLGNGMYFVVENLKLARHLANKQKLHIIGAKIELKNSLNLLKNEGQQKLELIYNDIKKSKEIITDYELFEELHKMSKIKYDSVIGLSCHEPMYSGSYIYRYMAEIVCVIDGDCIKKYFKV